MNSPATLRRIATLAALTLTLLPAAAAAQTPSDDGYQADGPKVQNQVESGDPPAAAETPSNPSDTRESRDNAAAALPFTGQDLGMLLAAGALLVGVGAGMRLLLKLPPPAR